MDNADFNIINDSILRIMDLKLHWHSPKPYLLSSDVRIINTIPLRITYPLTKDINENHNNSKERLLSDVHNNSNYHIYSTISNIILYQVFNI